MSHYFFIDLVALANPLRPIRWERALFSEPDAAVQCDPVHHLRVDEVLLAISHLPNSCVWTLPSLAGPVQTITNSHPHVVGNGTHVFVIQIKPVHQLSIQIELKL